MAFPAALAGSLLDFGALMLLDFGLLVLGAVCLYYGAEWLVGGAAGLARRLGVAPLAIGLTVVSYGTSAPELAVSLSAAIQGQSAIALGNVVGSNIANIGFILGLSALLAPPRVDRLLFRREVPLLLLATFALAPALLDGRISRVEGLLFSFGAVGFTWATLRWAKQRNDVVPADDDAAHSEPRGVGVLWGLLLLGIVVLVAGGQSFVTGAVGIAEALGVSERIVGLTVVAFGTSLPELAASAMAAYRGHSDLAVGNVVGSNLFNLLLILGLTSLIAPIGGNLAEIRSDLVWMTALTVVMAIGMYKERRITRWEGGAFLAAYLTFIGTLVVSG